MNKKISSLVILIISLILILFLIRLTSPKEIDDVSPEIPCEQKYIEKTNVLWVIPKLNDNPISKNEGWCNQVLNLNKTLGLHGVNHKFEEFGINRTPLGVSQRGTRPQSTELGGKEYLQGGMEIFEQCFGFKPEMFKPPQLKISRENKKLVKENEMELRGKFNQLIHKVYHCGDSGLFPNWVIDLV
ncbi:MAG: DUF2334 domain-containing protein [Nanoarchaeota archaeon]|nr:DUF2334 domain-containing protein [Nanoarchaeota archaeon]